MRRFTIPTALLLALAACGTEVPTAPSTSRASGASASGSVVDTLPPPPVPDSTTTSGNTAGDGGIMIGGAG